MAQPPEQCDDGNSSNDDGCDAACQFEYRIAFVSSVSYVGEDVADVYGGDDKCNVLASATDQLVGRTFRAWLSTEEVDARDRIGSSALPYRLADGTTIVASNSSTFNAR